MEVGGKYGSDAFTLFQVRTHAFTPHPQPAPTLHAHTHAHLHASEAPDVRMTCGSLGVCPGRVLASPSGGKGE